MKRSIGKAQYYLFLRHFLQVFSVILFAFFCINTSIIRTTDKQTSEQLAAKAEKMSRYHFIFSLVPIAQRTQKNDGILSSLTLGQACLESNFGQSLLASKYHNLFGVKAYGDVPTVKLNTKEYENGQWITITGQFRVYASDEASVKGHTRLLVNGTTWNPQQYTAVLTAKNYKTAAQAIQASGYATDPHYAASLIQLIESYHLQNYD